MSEQDKEMLQEIYETEQERIKLAKQQARECAYFGSGNWHVCDACPNYDVCCEVAAELRDQ